MKTPIRANPAYIKIRPETKERLRRLKIVEGETDDSLLDRLAELGERERREEAGTKARAS